MSVTERGRALAARLPFERAHGRAAATVRARWADVDAFVLFLATGAAVRIVAPLLADKRTDPAVVCVDEAAAYAVALCGGHAAGANRLAREVAARLDAHAVVTTATDAAGLPALDTLPGFRATGDVARVGAALLDGRPPAVENELGWPLPEFLAGAATGPARVVVSDRELAPEPGVVVLHPPSLVAGVGAARGAPRAVVAVLLAQALRAGGLARAALAEVATIDVKANEPGIAGLGLPVRTFAAADLDRVRVPTPSAVVRDAVGTASVAEAAALLAAGAGAELVVTKQVGRSATVAIARRRRPRGRLAVVGLGPGAARHRTPAADDAVRRADVVVGYEGYLDACRELLDPDQEVVPSAIGSEAVRAKQALAEAAAGRTVALVCSGDAGVYGMASLVLELAPDHAGDADIEVVPGVTAALAAAAVLGAPLGHDHVVLSLSDLLTPWATIERRLRAAAASDLVVVLYNPRSSRRDWQLDASRQVLLAGGRGPDVPVGVVTDATRPGQGALVTTLAGLDPRVVGMSTCVVVGTAATRVIGGRMVTPRGYPE